MRTSFTLLFYLFAKTSALAQSHKAIEADLLMSFKKISYCRTHTEKENWPILLEQANKSFGEKLKSYAALYNFTATYPFNSLRKEDLLISTSDDGLFRIYSWDTETGGTMHLFANVFQYKTGIKITSFLDTSKTEADIRPSYSKIYTLKAGSKSYYLVCFTDIGSSKDICMGLRVFTIEKAKLNDNVKIIKTQTGLSSELFYFNDLSLSDIDDLGIVYSASTKTLKFPLTTDKGKLTHQFITYKFTGSYFEKVKN